MANKLYEESYIRDIANAIREKNKGTESYKVSQMGNAIRSISSSEVTPLEFTNVLDLSTTFVKEGYRCTSTGYTETIDGVVVIVPVKEGTHRFRTRGKYSFGFRDFCKDQGTTVSLISTNMYTSSTAPTEESFNGTLIFNVTQIKEEKYLVGMDEYGDVFIDVPFSNDCYFGFTLKDLSQTFPHGEYLGEPILTIDEPIGPQDKIIEGNRAVFGGTITDTFVGLGVYAVLAKDPTLAEHRNDDSLFVRVEFDIDQTAYTVLKSWGANNIRRIPINTEVYHQYIQRLGTETDHNFGFCDYAINDDTEIKVSVGRIFIAEDGELRIYSNSNSNYAIRPSNYTVIVEW